MVKMVKRLSGNTALRQTVPSEQSKNFTNFRHAFGGSNQDVEPPGPTTPSGANAARQLPHRPVRLGTARKG